MTNKIKSIHELPEDYTFNFPPIGLLEKGEIEDFDLEEVEKNEENTAKILMNIINSPNIGGELIGVERGLFVTRYRVKLPQTTSFKKVTAKSDELNLWLGRRYHVRIDAPISGSSDVGIEIPNSHSGTVGLADILSSEEFENVKEGTLSFAVGMDIIGKPIVADMGRLNNILVAGATGSGKSAFLKSMLVSLMYKYSPEELRMVIVDPKMVEFFEFNSLPHLLFDKVIAEATEAEAMLEKLTEEMERRYLAFRESNVRDINEFNRKATEKNLKKMSKILVVIDEYADLYYNRGKKLNDIVYRLLTKSRAVGIYMVIATQRVGIDVLDENNNSSFATRIAFRMASAVDSILALCETGAETLIGYGDMLYHHTNTTRLQAAYLSAEELSAVCDYIKSNNDCYFDDDMLMEIEVAAQEKEDIIQSVINDVMDGDNDDIDDDFDGDNDDIDDDFDDDNDDGCEELSGQELDALDFLYTLKRERTDEEFENLIKSAMRIAITMDNISISIIQRKLSVGYPKAGRVLEALEDRGYVTPLGESGSQRKILMTREEFERVFNEKF